MSNYTDKELLILAARAAGFDISHPMNIKRQEMNPPVLGFVTYLNGELQSTLWNPLGDDGQALRLAVKLDMQLTIDIHGGESWVNHNALPEFMVEEYHGGDPYAATRRAIVRAAAAIGSEL
jgi:hypothetical protein